MKQHSFLLTFILMLIGQILLCNYFRVTQYVTLSILPVMIMCIPTKHSTTLALIAAFVTGLAVDMLSEGIIGLNVLALVPVAFVRQKVVKAIFGEEIFTRGGNFSIGRYGPTKVSFAILIAQSLFLFIYVLADGAGTRPLWFNGARFGASLLAGYLLSLFVVEMMSPDDRK